MDPTARFVYVANKASNEISAYSIGPTGLLTPVPGSPFAGADEPVSVVVDSTARFAYASNRASNNVSAYSIGSNGALTPAPDSPFATGIEPISVAVTRPVLK